MASAHVVRERQIINQIQPSIWGPWDVLRCPVICGFFSVAYKPINGTGEITLYLAGTGLP